MNWRLSQLDNCQIVSFSDAHSLPNLGREATVFEMPELTLKHFQAALRGGTAASKISETIEFYPEEGKYHWDGHRACNISYAPSETKKHQGICPVCKKELVVGGQLVVPCTPGKLRFEVDVAEGHEELRGRRTVV